MLTALPASPPYADRLGGANPGVKVCANCSGIRRLLVHQQERLRRVLETRRAVCCARRIWAVSSFHFPGFEERSEAVRPFLPSLPPSLPRGRAACQLMFPPVVSHSAEHSGPLILHYSPLLSSGSGELPDERRWSHSLGRGRRALLLFWRGGVLLPPPLEISALTERRNTVLIGGAQIVLDVCFWEVLSECLPPPRCALCRMTSAPPASLAAPLLNPLLIGSRSH
ncbi:hypothetical protein VZT92_014714 [Zoarces viviparus]|uniref:Uncharacterized protein n=1 Tax=Zoarces viviparus TaxID=48416 RepID=A0AAW1F051_ZOAVI